MTIQNDLENTRAELADFRIMADKKIKELQGNKKGLEELVDRITADNFGQKALLDKIKEHLKTNAYSNCSECGDEGLIELEKIITDSEIEIPTMSLEWCKKQNEETLQIIADSKMSEQDPALKSKFDARKKLVGEKE